MAASTGRFIFAPPGVKRTAFAQEPETTVIALGGTPGKADEPDGWELWAPLNPLYRGLAIDRSERCRSYTQDDSDFDLIRDEPAFKELIESKG